MFAPQKDNLRFFKGRYLFYTASSLFIIIFVLLAIFNYNFTSLDPENAVAIPKILSNGNQFKLEDLARSLDMRIISFGNSRPIFLSFLLQIINVKFRIWLLQFFPLPAGLSLIWLFIFILSPFLLFRFMFNLTSDTFTSWIAVLLFLVSQGCLFGGTYVFHHGKPLSIFLTIFCLYLASEINRSLNRRGPFLEKYAAGFILLLFTIFLGFFVDEIAYFIPVYIFLLFPNIFKGRRSLFFLVPVISFLIIITFLIPLIVKRLGYFTFGFWDFITGSMPSATVCVPSFHPKGALPFTWVFSHFKFTNFLLNGFFLFSNHINPFKTPTTRNFFKADIYFFILFFLYISFLYIRLSEMEKILFKRLGAVLAAFIIIHTILHLRHIIITPDVYYYGSLFSLFFVIWLAIPLSKTRGVLKYLNKFVFIFFILIFISNFYSTARRLNQELTQRYKGWFPKETQGMPEDKELTYSMAQEAWRNRYDKTRLAELKKGFPARSYWLFLELDYLTK